MRLADLRRTLAIVSLGWLVAPASCIGGEEDGLAPLARSVSGTWEVVQVSTYPSEDVDMELAEARAPAILHRLVRFGDAEISVEGSRALACASPSTSRKTLPMPELAAASFRGEMGMASPFFDSEESLDVLYVHCSGKPLRASLDGDGVERDVWLFTGSDKAYLRWTDGRVLWLERVDESSPVQASFDCAKAQSPTEKAICGSRSLASYDRSVKDAFDRWTSQHATDDAAERTERERIVASQRAWIRQRNACGADAACLEKSLRARVDAILGEVEKGLSAGG